MKTVTALFSLFLLLGAGCVSPRHSVQFLKITSKSQYQIVLPDQWNNPGLRGYCEGAARMLQRALKEGVGISAPIVKESRKKTGVKGIYLGATEANWMKHGSLRASVTSKVLRGF